MKSEKIVTFCFFNSVRCLHIKQIPNIKKTFIFQCIEMGVLGLDACDYHH